MFPEDWTGLEISSWPENPSQTLREEKEHLHAQALLKQRIATDIRMGLYSGGDQASYDALKKKLDIEQSEADRAKIAAHEFSRNYDSRVRDACAFERKQAVESTICNAIREVELKTYLNSGTVFGSMSDWTSHKDFSVSFSHSYIVTPATFQGRQKHRAYFLKTAFDKWSAPIQGRLSKYRTSSPEDDLIFWFKALVLDCEVKKSRMNRKTVLEECKSTFLRAGEFANLEKKVNAVWDLYVPYEWTKGGQS